MRQARAAAGLLRCLRYSTMPPLGAAVLSTRLVPASIDAAAASSATYSSVPDATMVRHKLPAYEFSEVEQRSLQHAKEVIKCIKDHGALALIVGGWVRDKYLNRPALDIDIATSATTDQLRQCFPRVKVLPRNTVRLSHQGQAFEVTTFRGSSTGAQLQSASFDAGLRDFTVNAVFYDPLEDTVLDFVGGVADLKRRVLRLCVDADSRLAEDPIRALRAVRFVASMGLRMVPETAQAIQRMAPRCSVEEGVPARRIYLELCKLNACAAKQPGSFVMAAKLLYHLGLLKGLAPFLHGDNALQQGMRVLTMLPPDMPLELRLAAMINPSSKRSVYQQACMYCQSERERANVMALADMAELLASNSGDRTAWVNSYAGQHASLLLDIIAAWMPPMLVARFKQEHQKRMLEWTDDIAAVQQRWVEAAAASRRRRHVDVSQQTGGQQEQDPAVATTADDEAVPAEVPHASTSQATGQHAQLEESSTIASESAVASPRSHVRNRGHTKDLWPGQHRRQGGTSAAEEPIAAIAV